MTLVEAYIALRSPNAGRGEQEESFAVIFALLRDEARRWTKESARQEEIASTVLVKLWEARKGIDRVEEPQVRSYLARAVKNTFLDQERYSKRTSELPEQLQAPASTGPSLDELFAELGERSTIIETGSPDPLAELVGFLRDTVAADLRRDAVQTAQEALDQMLRITQQEITFDELVLELAAKSETTEGKARQLVHQRHSRTRKRMHERLDRYELSEFDRRALHACITTLRSREASSDD